MDELSRQRGSEGYEVCLDEVKRKKMCIRDSEKREGQREGNSLHGMGQL